MKKLLYLIAFAGCAAMLFSYCKNNAPAAVDNGQDNAVTASADTLDLEKLYATTDSLTVTPLGTIRKNPIDGDVMEHGVNNAWRKLSIVVPGQETSDVPDMKAILKAIAEVYPMPMIIACLNGNAKGKFVEDEANHFISYVEDFYENADYEDNFRLKAFQFFYPETWAIGLAYHRLWDGDDGIGVYQNLMFWNYDPKGDKTLKPLNTDEYFLPEYTAQRGLVVFHAEGENIDFDGGADPELYWKWNGHWFDSSANHCDF